MSFDALSLQQIELNGVDYFMHAIDRDLRSRCMRGNTCVLMLETARRLDQEMVLNCFRAHPASAILGSLRLGRRFPWSSLKWQVCSGESQIFPFEECEVRSITELHNILTTWDLNPQNQGPFEAKLLHHNAKSFLAFAWQHSLMDAHGAELLCNSLIQPQHSEHFAKLLQAPQRLNWWENGCKQTLIAAHHSKQHIFKTAAPPLAAHFKSTSPIGTAAQYFTVEFTTSETSLIDQNCRYRGVQLFQSSVYLAATARALARFLERQGLESESFCVPVPHDTRRKTAQGPAFSNQITFLFFRISKDQRRDLTSCIHSLIEQSQQIVANKLHQKLRLFFELARYIPFTWYLKTLQKPAGGQLASFYFSDLGDSVSRFTDIAGIEISDVTHFPPCFSEPGVTLVFSRRAAKLRYTVIAAQGLISEIELQQLKQDLAQDLLTPE